MLATEDSLTLSYRTAGTVTLTGDDLSIEDVVRIARRGARVEVSREALGRVRRARDVVDRVLERGDLVYGMNTGVGSLSRYRIPSRAWSSSTYAFFESYLWSPGAARNLQDPLSYQVRSPDPRGLLRWKAATSALRS